MPVPSIVDTQAAPVPSLVETQAAPSVQLPPYTSTTDLQFVWGSFDGETFLVKLIEVYREVVCWRKNCFKVPYGSSGKKFVFELSRLFKTFCSSYITLASCFKSNYCYDCIITSEAMLFL